MQAAPGTVYLVGAGPGDPELITVRGLALLRTAGAIIHDRLIAPELLNDVRADAEVVDAREAFGRGGDAQDGINAWMIERALAGKSVVRLKGGDPFVFGRGGEELLACRDVGVNCVIVPGVTSAIAGPAAAGIPVTHRDIGRSFAIVTAHTNAPDGDDSPDYHALVGVDTVVIMMGRSKLSDTARQLIQAGWSGQTPAACIERATMPSQRVTRATLATIAAAADRDDLGFPAITIVGRTVALLDQAVASQTAQGTS